MERILWNSDDSVVDDDDGILHQARGETRPKFPWASLQLFAILTAQARASFTTGYERDAAGVNFNKS